MTTLSTKTWHLSSGRRSVQATIIFLNLTCFSSIDNLLIRHRSSNPTISLWQETRTCSQEWWPRTVPQVCIAFYTALLKKPHITHLQLIQPSGAAAVATVTGGLLATRGHWTQKRWRPWRFFIEEAPLFFSLLFLLLFSKVEAMKKLEKRVKRYLPVELDVDTSYLNNTQVCHCHCLLSECKYMFLRWRNFFLQFVHLFRSKFWSLWSMLLATWTTSLRCRWIPFSSGYV